MQPRWKRRILSLLRRKGCSHRHTCSLKSTICLNWEWIKLILGREREWRKFYWTLFCNTNILKNRYKCQLRSRGNVKDLDCIGSQIKPYWKNYRRLSLNTRKFRLRSRYVFKILRVKKHRISTKSNLWGKLLITWIKRQNNSGQSVKNITIRLNNYNQIIMPSLMHSRNLDANNMVL